MRDFESGLQRRLTEVKGWIESRPGSRGGEEKSGQVSGRRRRRS
jgi:hypothetical protein